MPRFDGTGPRGEGPFSGRGEGYCAVELPEAPGQPAKGYAGWQGRSVVLREGWPQRVQPLPLRCPWLPDPAWHARTARCWRLNAARIPARRYQRG